MNDPVDWDASFDAAFYTEHVKAAVAASLALNDAIVGLLGGIYHDPHGWAGRGWTVDALGEVARLADWALAHRTHLAQARNRSQLGLHLITAWEILDGREELPDGGHWEPLPAAQALSWIGLLTAAPTLQAWAGLHDALTKNRRADVVTFTRWRALGVGGALAYAAGLSVDEAAALLAPYGRDAVSTSGMPGNLVTLPASETERLRTLTALRGWPLPPATG